MATAKDKVRETYPKAHATKHTRHGLKGDYWLVWDQRTNPKRLGTGTTQAAAWKDALDKSLAPTNELGAQYEIPHSSFRRGTGAESEQGLRPDE